MKDDESAGKPELVIVRRRGGDNAAGGKAGAWKIAYADFVTAMMAFFLVMWLINASNEETRAQVASYFNPIKLTDASTGERSLKDMKETANPERRGADSPATDSAPSRREMEAESKLLSDPLEVLEEIAHAAQDAAHSLAGLQNPDELTPSVRPDHSNPGVGDPFDPLVWEKVDATSPGTEAEADRSSPDDGSSGEPVTTHRDVGTAKTEDENAVKNEMPTATQGDGTTSAVSHRSAQQTEEEDASAISQEISEKLGPNDRSLEEAFSVKASENGVLISLTEGESFEMFETGSAEPRPETLKLVNAIAEVIQARQGSLVIRGHTDSRPYRNRYYDNWQLSTARAHFARYMLQRGGLDERRIRRVEGVADREPRNAADPQAAENRRIDILIESAER